MQQLSCFMQLVIIIFAMFKFGCSKIIIITVLGVILEEITCALTFKRSSFTHESETTHVEDMMLQ